MGKRLFARVVVIFLSFFFFLPKVSHEICIFAFFSPPVGETNIKIGGKHDTARTIDVFSLSDWKLVTELYKNKALHRVFSLVTYVILRIKIHLFDYANSYAVTNVSSISFSSTDDYNRVVLDTIEGEPDSDYVNASYVDVSRIHSGFVGLSKKRSVS